MLQSTLLKSIYRPFSIEVVYLKVLMTSNMSTFLFFNSNLILEISCSVIF